MLKEVDKWDKDKTYNYQLSSQKIKSKIIDTQSKIDKLVSAYIDGDIPKESYLTKKEELLKQKSSLNQEKDNSKQTTKNPLEPLRQWILDTKKANFLASSDDYHQIREIVPKIGTNPRLSDKSFSLPLIPPFQFLASRLAGRADTFAVPPTAERLSGLSKRESSIMSGCWELNPV
ncbi:MAG: hypothetical protein Q8R55_04750 [Candidatus Taylorbacteria bacterium]|nr:hypothetical protein [Candidatus Taylorbacteria bacterium]